MHAIRDHSLMPPKCCQIEIDANLVFDLLEPADAQEVYKIILASVHHSHIQHSSASTIWK